MVKAAAARGRPRSRVLAGLVVALLGIVVAIEMPGATAYAAPTHPPTPDSRTGQAALAAVHPLGADPAGVPPGLPAQTGSVTGRVTDAGGRHGALATVAVRVSSPTTGSSVTLMTGVDGRYTAPGLFAGTDYIVCFDGGVATGGSHDGFGYVVACYRDALGVVSVSPGRATQVDAALPAGGVVTGVASDAVGHRPLAGVRVSITGTGVVGSERAPVSTGADGSYRLRGLAAGTDYVVCFAGDVATGGSSDALGYGAQCFDRRPESVTATTVTAMPGRTRSGVDALLVPAGGVAGRVIEAGGTGHGLAGVTVTVTTAASLTLGVAPVRRTTTAPDGSYAVRGLAPDPDYRICFLSKGAQGGAGVGRGYVDQCYAHTAGVSTATPVRVAAGTTTTGRNAALGLAGAIAGRVTEQAVGRHGLAGVVVTVTSPSPGGGVVARTDAAGDYVVSSLAPGAGYRVCYTSDRAVGGTTDEVGYVGECYNGQVGGGATPVTVVAGATRSGTDATLAAAGAISGRVTDLGTAAAGLANVVVSTYSAKTRSSGFVATSSDGTYRLAGLAPGPDYVVCFAAGRSVTGGRSAAWGYVGECWGARTGTQGWTPIKVATGRTTASTDASLSSAGALAGRVTDASPDKRPLAGVSVAVTSAAHGFGSARTAADGTWTVPALPPGSDYRVCFSATSGATGGSSDPLGYVDGCVGGGTALVTVVGGATTAVSGASLAAAGGISGRVRDAGGAHHGLAGVLVEAFPGLASPHAWTAPDGSYHLTGLPPGTDYRVSFDASTGVVGGSGDTRGYRSEWFDNAPDAASATPVTVVGGSSRIGTDAALTPAG